MSLVDFTWLIGGPQGSGVESGANIFSRCMCRNGLSGLWKKRILFQILKVNIVILQSEFLIQVIHSNVNDVTLMASFDAETIFRQF